MLLWTLAEESYQTVFYILKTSVFRITVFSSENLRRSLDFH
jgi:hypothetical protein